MKPYDLVRSHESAPRLSRRRFVKGLALGGAAASFGFTPASMWAQKRAPREPTSTLSGTNLEAYNTNVFLSRDMGKTWSKPVQLHRDKKIRQHGFVSFVPTADQRLGSVWLDGRQLSNSNEGDIALIYATIGKDGSIRGETTLDRRVCECCQTAAAATAAAALVVYRDRSPKEIRDISIVRYANGKWSAPATVATDGWEIDACPVNGPSISASGRGVAGAWFTVANDKSRVNVAYRRHTGHSDGNDATSHDHRPTAGSTGVVNIVSARELAWINLKESRGLSGGAPPCELTP